MKSIRRVFVLLLAVLMLIGMALPVCAEELATGDETIVEETTMETPSEQESSTDAEPSTEEDASTEESSSTETPSGEETSVPAPEVQAAALLPEDESVALDGDSEIKSLKQTTVNSYISAGRISAGSYRLDGDITLDQSITLNGAVTLDLNGHTLSYSGTGCAITTNYHTLTLTNGSSSTGMVTTASKTAIAININGGQLTTTGGAVAGNVTITNGGQIHGAGATQFKSFPDGTTATVTNSDGFIYTGTFMSGCKVVNNASTDYKGIISGTFNGTVEGSGTIENGTFNGSVDITGTIQNGTFSGAVTSGGTIQSGSFTGAVSVTSTGTIQNGSFTGTVYNNGYLTGGTYSNTVTNGGSVTGGTFKNKVTNGGSITGGSFTDTVENSTGTINGGTYSAAVTNMQRGTLQSGTFSAAVTNDGTIKGGTFSSTVMNRKTIENGTFNGTVENHETITGGTFNNDVTNLSTITGGTFNKPVNSRQHGSITGGTFNSTVTNGGSITGGSFYGGDPDSGIVDNKYTVSFDPDGGTLNGQTTIPSQYFIGSSGGPAKNPGTPSKLGYTFDGWYNGAAKYGFTETVSASITLKATWKPSDGPTFIGLETGGKYCSSVDFSVLDHSGSSVTVTASPGTLTKGEDGKYTLSAATGEVTVTATNAKGNTTSVTVTLYAAHTGSASCTVSAPCANCGEMYYIPHTLTRVPAKANTSSEAGNREHWKCSVCSKCFADETGKTELDSITTALPKLISLTQDNIDNYLHLVTDSWILSVGSRVDVSYYYRLDTDIDISEKGLIEFSQIDCTLDLNGHTLRLNELTIANKSLILTDSSTAGTGCLQGRMRTNNATLYAAGGRIVSETNSSSIHGNLQALPGSAKTTVFDTQVIILSSGRISTGTFCKPVTNGGTISGGIFHGYVSGNGRSTGKITGGVFYGGVADGMIGEDETVYTVTFDSKGGSGSIPQQVFVNTDTATAHKPADPTYAGHAFVGWYKSGESEPYDFSAPVTGSFTLEARWRSYGYTITYEPNGGTLPESYPTSYATGSTISLPKPTKTGHTFEGWYESADFSGDKITAIAPSDARNITLYANWTQSQPTGDGKPASIGSQSYDTLADALAAAKNGDQIMLKANANPAESVAVGKEVIIVNPGFTGYTITAAEGYAMTTSTVGSIAIHSFKHTGEAPTETAAAKIGDTEYATVSGALNAATSGQTVTVVAEASDGNLIVKSGVTLDLNGFDLTADALVALTGAKVQNSGTTGGLLKVTKGNVKLDASNPQTTLWLADEGGYQLVSVTHHTNFYSKSESRFQATSWPQFDAAIDTLLANGDASDKGMSVQMKIQWTNASGIVQSQTYQFTDTHVHEVYANEQMFVLTVTGISNIQQIDVTAVVVSDTGVNLASSAIHYDKADLSE